MARKIPEINAGSTADIAFLLLIFFLVTTTMDIDTGILRRLPPPPKPNEKIPEVKERNVLVVLVNKDNQLAVRGDLIDVKDLRTIVKEFIANPNDNPNYSEQATLQELLDLELQKTQGSRDEDMINKLRAAIEVFGPNMRKTKGVISMQNDRATLYSKYIEVQNEIVGAINELRDELSKQQWGVPFDKLTTEQQDLVQLIYPFNISEAEPRRIGALLNK